MSDTIISDSTIMELDMAYMLRAFSRIINNYVHCTQYFHSNIGSFGAGIEPHGLWYPSKCRVTSAIKIESVSCLMVHVQNNKILGRIRKNSSFVMKLVGPIWRQLWVLETYIIMFIQILSTWKVCRWWLCPIR